MKKSLAIGAGCLGLLLVAGLILSQNDEDPVSPGNMSSQPQETLQQNKLNTIQNDQAFEQPLPIANTKANLSKRDLVYSETKQIQPDSSINSSIQALSQLASEELRLEESLSAHNLMVIQDLAARIHDLSLNSEAPFQLATIELNDLPEEFMDVFNRLYLGMQAEHKMNTEWQENILRNPEAYKTALLAEQSEILGKELYEKIYGEDQLQMDEARLHANFEDKDDPSLKKDLSHQRRLELLTQWQNNEISSESLKEVLASELNQEEIEQVMTSSAHESDWLDKVDGFLEEYRYIELSGISGEDEQQMRRELLEKHFPKEEQAVVNQFLFKAN